jgi:hypothetical protein
MGWGVFELTKTKLAGSRPQLDVCLAVELLQLLRDFNSSIGAIVINDNDLKVLVTADDGGNVIHRGSVS